MSCPAGWRSAAAQLKEASCDFVNEKLLIVTVLSVMVRLAKMWAQLFFSPK